MKLGKSGEAFFVETCDNRSEKFSNHFDPITPPGSDSSKKEFVRQASQGHCRKHSRNLKHQSRSKHSVSDSSTSEVFEDSFDPARNNSKILVFYLSAFS